MDALPLEVETRGGQWCPLPDDDERDHGEVVEQEVEGAAGEVSVWGLGSGRAQYRWSLRRQHQQWTVFTTKPSARWNKH